MANCAKCGKAVGCGCNLQQGGLCATCAEEKRKADEAALKQQQEDVKPK